MKLTITGPVSMLQISYILGVVKAIERQQGEGTTKMVIEEADFTEAEFQAYCDKHGVPFLRNILEIRVV